jgi:hypothetical protein
MNGLKTKVCIPLLGSMQCNEYSIPLEVHCVKKVYGHLANGSENHIHNGHYIIYHM